jgi:hypothetical protein
MTVETEVIDNAVMADFYKAPQVYVSHMRSQVTIVSLGLLIVGMIVSGLLAFGLFAVPLFNLYTMSVTGASQALQWYMIALVACAVFIITAGHQMYDEAFGQD